MAITADSLCDLLMRPHVRLGYLITNAAFAAARVDEAERMRAEAAAQLAAAERYLEACQRERATAQAALDSLKSSPGLR